MQDSHILHSRSLISSILNGTTCPSTAARCGWVSQPNFRGTMDIIWSCVCALFICLWVMLHLNVPAKDDGFWCIFARKSRWLVLGLLTPELVLLSACGQWASAQRSVRDMKALGYNEWTMAHAFYADSGGFLLKPLCSFPFPITAKQLHYLVGQGYLGLPAISVREICDKSKADKFTKTIAALQLCWLVLQCVARAIQKISVTPLELSTVAIILCTASTYFFWLHKPLNAELPTILETDVSTADILLHGGEAAKDPFRDTPLDFVEPKVYTLNLFRGEWKRFSWFASNEPRPLNRIPNDRNPQFNAFYQRFLLASIVASFSTIHFFGWNFDFPSKAEQILWRTCCVTAEASLGAHGAHEIQQYFFSPNYRERPYIQDAKVTWPSNLLFILPAGLYFVARMTLLVGVFISMRSLPPDAFVSVQWTAFIPHL